MGIYDRDYMRRENDEPPPDAPLDERVAGRLVGFLRRHPGFVKVVIGILVALLVLALVAIVFTR